MVKIADTEKEKAQKKLQQALSTSSGFAAIGGLNAALGLGSLSAAAYYQQVCVNSHYNQNQKIAFCVELTWDNLMTVLRPCFQPVLILHDCMTNKQVPNEAFTFCCAKSIWAVGLALVEFAR